MADALERCCNSIRKLSLDGKAEELASDLFHYETDAFYDLLQEMRKEADRWDASTDRDKKAISRK